MKINVWKVVASASVVLGAAALMAAPNVAADPIHGCVSTKGRIRIVPAGTVCGRKETPLDWSNNAIVGVQRVDFSSRASSNSPKKAFALCPAGKTLLGGGGKTIVAGGTSAPLALRSSLPDANMHGWAVTAEEAVPTSATWYVTAYALCGTVGP